MADTYAILGQSNPSAATLTDAYTVPAATTAIVSSIVVANRSTTATSFRISLAVEGAADDDKQYIYYDLVIDNNDTFVATIGITLGPRDVVRVYATLATLSFTILGAEIT